LDRGDMSPLSNRGMSARAKAMRNAFAAIHRGFAFYVADPVSSIPLTQRTLQPLRHGPCG